MPPDRDEGLARTFQSFTGDLHRLTDWLLACRSNTVAMKSIGVYGNPLLYEILETRGGQAWERSDCGTRRPAMPSLPVCTCEADTR